MSEPTETQAQNTTPAVQEHADGAEVIVTKGTKNLPNGEALTVLGFDAVLNSYAARRPDGRIVNVKAGNVGPKPERTFTESEVREALQTADPAAELGIDLTA